MEEAVNTAAQSSPSELMAHFQASLAVTTADDLTAKVLLAISCIEGGTSIAGSVSFARKAKSLVQRWLAKPVNCMSSGENALQTNDVIIERDTIVLLNVKFGKGASAATVQINFRVMEVYEKHYNKLFMSKQPLKNGRRSRSPTS